MEGNEELEVEVIPAGVPETAPEPESGAEGDDAVQPEAKADGPEEGKLTLPDGRQVTGEEAVAEYAKLQSEFTRRSQRLAELERKAPANPEPINKPQGEAKKPWEDPEWQPKSWAEAMEAQADYLRHKADMERQAEESARNEVVGEIGSQIAEIRKSEPNLDEAKLLAHAQKYGFGRNVTGAYRNMMDMKLTAVRVERKVESEMKRRAEGSAPTGAEGENDGFSYSDFRARADESPLEALRRLSK